MYSNYNYNYTNMYSNYNHNYTNMYSNYNYNFIESKNGSHKVTDFPLKISSKREN